MGRKTFLLAALFLILSTPPLSQAAVSPDGAPGWFVNLNDYAQSAHGTFSCTKCHGDMEQRDTIHPNSGYPDSVHPDPVHPDQLHPDSDNPRFLKTDANRRFDYRRCSTCHKPSFEQYQMGAHADALKKQRSQTDAQYNRISENKKAPTCGTCHSSHYARAHLSRVEIGRHMVTVCGACHPAQTATYLENYHGKAAVNLGNKHAAFCTDCHGAHHCLSLKDPKTALAACRRCHPKATESFARVIIHPTTQDLPKNADEKRAHVALIRVVTLLMSILVILVVGFFYGHSFIWILRELHEKLRKHKP